MVKFYLRLSNSIGNRQRVPSVAISVCDKLGQSHVKIGVVRFTPMRLVREAKLERLRQRDLVREESLS